MSDISFSIKKTRITTLSRSELDQMAYLQGMGTYLDPSTLPVRFFNDLFTGEPMRLIGTIYYSPQYQKKRGGVWRIGVRNNTTQSDVCVLLETLLPIMATGPSNTDTWKQKPFSNHSGWFRFRSVCRPLSDYTGDELLAMVTLPTGLETPTHDPLNDVSQTYGITGALCETEATR